MFDISKHMSMCFPVLIGDCAHSRLLSKLQKLTHTATKSPCTNKHTESDLHTVGIYREAPTSDDRCAGCQKNRRRQQDIVWLWIRKSDNEEDHRPGVALTLIRYDSSVVQSKQYLCRCKIRLRGQSLHYFPNF